MNLSEGKNEEVINIITTNFECLGILHYDSNISTVSFAEQCKVILTEFYRIAFNICHLDMKNRMQTKY